MTTINTNTFATYLKDGNRDQLISTTVSQHDQLEDQFIVLQRQYRFTNVEAYCLIEKKDPAAYRLYRALVKRYGVEGLNKRYAYA